jgi:SAM-dependent methyltransferase
MTHDHDTASGRSAEARHGSAEPQAYLHGHSHGHGHGHGAAADFSEMAELLDLDAEVFQDYFRDATALVREVTDKTAVRRIADLGCGTGTGTLALAREFPHADLYAVDAAEPLLERLRSAASAQGVAERIHPVLADLDHEWPQQLRDLDLVWASVSVHHLADPQRGLAGIGSGLVPGGWVALMEVDDVLRFHPTFLPGPPQDQGGLESRARAALVPDMTAAMPYLGADWGALLTGAGFTVVAERAFDLALMPPLPAATGRYALVNLRRLRDQLQRYGREAQITAEDLAALDELVGEGPGSVLSRDDLSPRARRHLWVARRP